TIYSVSEDKSSIVSKVKTGLNSFKDLKLPIAEHSLAGYVAFAKKAINIKDCYDDNELRAINPNLRFLQEVDKRTGYRTKQQLVAPIVEQGTGELIGVIQIINNKAGVPFGALAEEGVAELSQTIGIAFKQRSKPQLAKTKYDYLIADAVLSAGEFELAARQARKKAIDIEQVLTDEFQVKVPAIGAALSKFFGVPYEPFKSDRVKPAELLKNLKREYVEGNQWVPIDDTKEGLVVVCLDPERIRSSRIAANVFPKARIIYRVTTQKDWKETVNQLYGQEGGTGADLGNVEDLLSGMEDDSAEATGAGGEGSADEASAAADNELVKLVNKIIVDAYNQNTSDIHIEPYPGKAKTEIRFRKDGSLGPYIEIPASYRAAIVARIKIMCDLDISEKRKPQDGKIKFKKFGPLDIELRVATIPTAGGVEDIVMRILAAGEPIPLEKMGFTPFNLDKLQTTVSKPYGLFFVCGPTGSGKTTTLHSVLKFLNTPDTKIWTAEDPVEITQKGLRQVQVNKKAGLDFAAVMKAFLRADPDIIMVGEMRDKETTGTGIEASLTGHLVFATLHTNSAPESITRLLDMGMDPFNFSDALLGILAQRLAKRMCSCKQAYTPEPAELTAFLREYCEELMATPKFKADPKGSMEAVYKEWVKNYGNDKGQLSFYKPVGCDKCGGSGFKGRCGLHELLIATDKLKKLIQEHARVAEMLGQCLDDGMRTLKQDGMEKCLTGVTHMKEVRAVCVK
ncbi:MAG: Flp pilus assembly complex ATPase component TadA, partial [Betaproteobacteria bacterium]|nr:Flp pilus assembly complex ATPase component TadA [Betaproteobacteria bacterium]MBV9361540.1 Flp pilus assembly complex ATPase component TadA [Betaproteobacteria bacterium]